MLSDLDIARATTLRPITQLATENGFPEESLTAYGKWKAKVDHRLGDGEAKADGKYILVTAITPTPAGEGKTVHTIGLSLALNKLGKRAVASSKPCS